MNVNPEFQPSPRKIVLIACSARKAGSKAKAKDLYQGELFERSWVYAIRQGPDHIFILSALHGSLDPENEIAPYNVTLGPAPKKKRAKPVKVLTASERKAWGEKVIGALAAVCDLQRDEFIILAGQAYIKPIVDHIPHLHDPLRGLSQGLRLAFLNKHQY